VINTSNDNILSAKKTSPGVGLQVHFFLLKFQCSLKNILEI